MTNAPHCLRSASNLNSPQLICHPSFTMSLQEIEIPESTRNLPQSASATQIIEFGYERIEAFLLSTDSVSENFVPCDFHLVDQSLTWIEQNHLLAGYRFCEWGCGFGVAAILAADRGWESVGIEIEPMLFEQANKLATDLDRPVQFYCDSFVPRGIAQRYENSVVEVERVEVHESDVYEDIGLDLDDFHLFFAYPWPGEQHFFEAVFESGAATNALLLMYCGREGMKLVRKV